MKRIVSLAVVLVLVAAACSGTESTDAVDAADPSAAPARPEDQAEDPAAPADEAEDSSADPATDDASNPGATTLADGWTVQNLGTGAKPVLALDGGGGPAVAWLSEAIGEVFVSFASASQGWIEERIVEGYFYGPIGLDFRPDDVPHIVYHDHQADTFQDDLGDLTHAVRADGWSVTAIGSGPVEYEWNVALAVSDSGQVGLSYFDNNSADLVFASLTEGEWQLETVDAEGDVGRFSSLVFDDADNPHISYYANDGDVRYATETIDGWSFEDVGRLEAVEISFSGARRITAIDLDSSGSPHIAFGDLQVVRHAIRTGDAWTVTDVLQSTDAPLGQLVSLAVGADDAVHIATYTGSAAQPAEAEILSLTAS